MMSHCERLMRHLRRTAFVAVQVSSLLFIEEIALAEVGCLAMTGENYEMS